MRNLPLTDIKDIVDAMAAAGVEANHQTMAGWVGRQPEVDALTSRAAVSPTDEQAAESIYDLAYSGALDTFLLDGMSALNASDCAHRAGLTAVVVAARTGSVAVAAAAAGAWLRGSPLILDGNAGFIADNVEAYIINEVSNA
jgi:hypothetical protein